MNRSKRTIAIGAALALAATGGGVAYAATSGSNPQDELLNDAAQRLNVRPEALRSALQGAFEDQLDDAVRAGRLTQRQADRIKQQIEEHGVPLGGPGGPGGPGFGHGGPGGPGGPIGPGLDAAADYLGLTRPELGRRLMNGRSLAQVARAQGKSVDGLEDAIVAAAKADLDRAVADGDLTQAQADEMLRGLTEHVDELVAGKGPGGHHRGGPGGPGGPPPPFREDRDGDRAGNEPGSFTAPAAPAGVPS